MDDDEADRVAAAFDELARDLEELAEDALETELRHDPAAIDDATPP